MITYRISIAEMSIVIMNACLTPHTIYQYLVLSRPFNLAVPVFCIATALLYLFAISFCIYIYTKFTKLHHRIPCGVFVVFRCRIEMLFGRPIATIPSVYMCVSQSTIDIPIAHCPLPNAQSIFEVQCCTLSPQHILQLCSPCCKVSISI